MKIRRNYKIDASWPRIKASPDNRWYLITAAVAAMAFSYGYSISPDCKPIAVEFSKNAPTAICTLLHGRLSCRHDMPVNNIEGN